jgi:hypothetical protein
VEVERQLVPAPRAFLDTNACRDVAGTAVRDRSPWTLWLAPALVAVLRALPWMATLGGAPTAVGVLPPIGYNPKDWLQYVAFIREAAAGFWIVANPFTTAPQDGRYVQGFFDMLGFVSRWTGANPFTVLELSRIPLLFLLLAAFWHVTGVVLDDRRDRALAWAAHALGRPGGGRRSARSLPPATGPVAAQSGPLTPSGLEHVRGVL